MLLIIFLMLIPISLIFLGIFKPNTVSTLFLHPISFFKYFFSDIYLFLVHKGFNLYSKIGRVYCFSGAFGKGKTLAMVHEARTIYKRYNGKVVFWKNEFRIQKIKIYSNVPIFDIPYTPLNSLMDIVDVSNNQPKLDDQYHIHTVSIFLIDELSSLLNSRSFASNLNFDVIGSLLQCRKSSSKLLYTAQNFCEVDALIRRNTHYVVECNKIWRFQLGSVFNGLELEYAVNPTLIKPIRDFGFFVKNSDYNSYDTLSKALSVDKNKVSQDFISNLEAYSRISPSLGNLQLCNRLNNKGKKHKKGAA